MKFALLILLLISNTCYAEIFKWTDENGQVHFSDRSDASRPADSVVVTVKISSYKNVTYETVSDDASDNEDGGSDTHAANQPVSRVIMYSTSWCTYCAQARAYFRKSNIPFTEYDIEKSETAKRKYDALGGKGVPVILVGNKRMNGFSISGFKSIYD